jgi:hypothetical protein
MDHSGRLFGLILNQFRIFAARARAARVAYETFERTQDTIAVFQVINQLRIALLFPERSNAGLIYNFKGAKLGWFDLSVEFNASSLGRGLNHSNESPDPIVIFRADSTLKPCDECRFTGLKLRFSVNLRTGEIRGSTGTDFVIFEQGPLKASIAIRLSASTESSPITDLKVGFVLSAKYVVFRTQFVSLNRSLETVFH